MRLGLPRWLPFRRARRLAVIAAATVAGYVLLTFFQVLQASGEDNRRPGDAIVVLGAAQYDGAPSPVLASRLDHAYELWASGVADMIVTTGSNQPGDRFTEGYAGFQYLLLAGVPEDELLVVTDGASSYEQLAATARQLRGLDIGESVILVSDPYHALRLRQIADQVGLDATVSSTDGGSSIRQLVRETAAVSLGRILGYRRVDNWLGSVG